MRRKWVGETKDIVNKFSNQKSPLTVNVSGLILFSVPVYLNVKFAR
jgi:hypothetical protein